MPMIALQSYTIGGKGYCVLRRFQQYFSYIVAISLLVEERGEKTTALPQITHKLNVGLAD
jgi:hypothetical protein